MDFMNGFLSRITARSVVLAVSVVLALASPAPAAGPVDKVTGTYTYFPFGNPNALRAASIDAHGTDPVKGTWSLNDRSGPVTCLVVQGADAFMFGPAAVGGRAAFFWVHDGGMPGSAGDLAVTWIQDLPGDDLPPGLDPQTIEEMESWCLNASGPDGIQQFPVASGNLTVRAAQ
jgi:hypothetical protein